jgi:glycosyltransferase involved in cell wall biosynthesis
MMSVSRRLKVLLLIDTVTTSGGAERFAVALATHLPRERFEVWMCSSRDAHPEALALLADAGVHHVNLGRTGKLDVHRLGGLIRLLRTGRFDILHAQKFGSNLWGSLIGAACRTPVIIAHEHSWSYEGEPLRRWLDGQVIARFSQRFVAVSNRDAERMVSIEQVPAEKVVMIPTGYIPRPDSGTDLRAEIGIDGSTPLIAAVALLRPEKALWVLLDALPAVLDSAPDAHLVIAGDGECRDELVAHAGRLGLSERIHFLGLRDDAEEVLRAADVAVICSDREGSPLVASECFAIGTPLVATAVGGLVEMIEDGVTGRLVPRRDPAALAAAIAGLLADPEARDRIAAAARERSVDIDTVAARVAELYETLAAEHGLIAAPAPPVDPVTA